MEQNINPVVCEERICRVCLGSWSFSLRWDQWFPTYCTSLSRRYFVLFKQRQNAARFESEIQRSIQHR